MTGIQNFREIRRDGRVIPEGMSVEAIARLGSTPVKIAALAWDSDAGGVELKAKHGILSLVLPKRDGVAVIEKTEEAGFVGSLYVVNADGSKRLAVSNLQRINGSDESGQFRWLEKPRGASPNSFGAVFELDRDHSQFRLDIDVVSGATVGVYEMR